MLTKTHVCRLPAVGFGLNGGTCPTESWERKELFAPGSPGQDGEAERRMSLKMNCSHFLKPPPTSSEVWLLTLPLRGASGGAGRREPSRWSVDAVMRDGEQWLGWPLRGASWGISGATSFLWAFIQQPHCALALGPVVC